VRLLLDTQMLPWWDWQLPRVPRVVRDAIEDSANEIFVSVASVWEIAIKRATNRLEYPAPIVATIERLGFALLEISGAHAEHAGGLPRHHDDPFDRLIVAQAYLESLLLATSDRTLGKYDVPTLGLDRG
jgi:PIN domain nuclease of toxin-antitoxin system